MTVHRIATPTLPWRQRILVLGLVACGGFFGQLGHAVAATPEAKAKAPAKTTAKAPAKGHKPVKAAPPVVVALTPASAEQLDAAERVYYGVYDCEFKQSIEITADAKNVGYVDVRHAKAVYTMKPVLSTTGAIRLEDVRGVMLMVQIAQKSMLMDVKVGHRVVDDCISPKQRELMQAARAQKEADAVAAAAAASAPQSMTPQSTALDLAPMSVAPPASAASGI